MAAEQMIAVRVSRRLINWLTSIMPAMEGLFLITVLDGKAGRVVFRFHQSTAQDVSAFVDWMIQHFGPEVQREPEDAG